MAAREDILKDKLFVASAIRDARIAGDDRGLMKLEEARRWLARRKVFRKGDGEMIDGTFVLESDRTWAALLSLEDSGEFVTQATRLQWRFHVRGRDNIAPHERYGDAILPWLRSRLKKGVLYNVPWCVLPCLLEIGTREALVLALEAHAVHELLPGQPQLGEGPGAFAQDEIERGNEPVPEVTPEEARVLLGASERLDVARQWLARHPDLIGEAEKLAAEGDARAAALVESQRALTVLSPEAQAVLDEAETLDEPPGPAWTIGELDEASQKYEIPIWDNARYTTAAMKVTGFASREGDVFFVECLTTSAPREDYIFWSAYAYGPGVTRRDSGQELADVAGDELEPIELGGGNYVSGVSSHIHVDDEDGERIIPTPLPAEELLLTLKRPISKKKVSARADWHFPGSFADLPEKDLAELTGVTPREALLVSVARRYPEAIFAEDKDLHTRCKGKPHKLFSFTHFEWFSAGEPAHTSLDVRTMFAALQARKKITRLPGTPNSTPEYWLPRCSILRETEGDGGGWPEGESPIVEDRPLDGPGVTPYWSWLLARGYPHGAMLMHSSHWNQKGMAEQTVPYLVNAAAPAMQVYWPRRAAILWARAVGSAQKKWAADDAGVAKAVGNDAMLHGAEARQLIARFVATELGAPRHVGSDLVDVLEALVGGALVVQMFADALKGNKIAKDRPALAGALFELGFVIHRIGPGRDEARAQLAKLWTKPMQSSDTDVARALDLVLNGKQGAERSAATELDYAHVESEHRAWAQIRILEAEPSRPSALLVSIAGHALIDKYLKRAASEDTFLVAQLGKLGGERAVQALLELHAREHLRDTIKHELSETRPAGKQELTSALQGPLAAAARSLLEAIRQSGS